MLRSKKKKVVSLIELPTEYEEPVDDINEYAFLIHGEKKIGKTTLANQGGRSLFIQFDPKQRAYKRLELQCPDYRAFLEVLKALEKAARKGKYPYDRTIVDGADTWFHRCQDWVCEKLAIDHPEDLQWGKGWSALRKEFTSAVDRTLNLPGGKWFLCHSSWKEIETRRGPKIEKLLPTLGKTAEEVLNGKVDGWFAYDYADDDRILIVRGDERTGAGHRLDSEEFPHFRTKDGKLIKEIHMGSSPKEAHDNLLRAFHNKQEYVDIASMQKLSKRRVRVRAR